LKREDLKDFIMEILSHVDYDIAKSYDPETAEEPEYAESEMETLLDFAEKQLTKIEKKSKKK
jgi:hypothetical protein